LLAEADSFQRTVIPEQYAQLLQEQRDIGYWMVPILSCLNFSSMGSPTGQFPTLLPEQIERSVRSQISQKYLHNHYLTMDRTVGQRNGDRHGINSTAKAIAHKEQAIREMTILYSYKDKVLQRHQQIFLHDIEHHLQGNKTTFVNGLIPINRLFSKAFSMQK
jgi:hypothetical protein